MIYIGLNAQEKSDIINKEIQGYDQVFLFHSDDYQDDLVIEGDDVTKTNYSESIWYRTFYPLMQNINKRSIIIVNEYIKDSNRMNLVYNCLKGFINQCGKVLVFQYTPWVYQPEDFLKLLDWNNPDKSRMIRTLTDDLYTDVVFKKHEFEISKNCIELSDKELKQYETLKNKLFDDLGLGDPHTIPRQLHLTLGKTKLNNFNGDKSSLLVRNMRLKCGTKYDDIKPDLHYTILDFPMAELAFTKFLYNTKQHNVDALITNAKVDEFYFNRYNEFLININQLYLKGINYD